MEDVRFPIRGGTRYWLPIKWRPCPLALAELERAYGSSRWLGDLISAPDIIASTPERVVESSQCENDDMKALVSKYKIIDSLTGNNQPYIWTICNMSTEKTLAGSCHYGATKFHVTILGDYEPKSMFCHCTTCAVLSGSLGTYSISFPLSSLTWDSKSKLHIFDEAADSGRVN